MQALIQEEVSKEMEVACHSRMDGECNTQSQVPLKCEQLSQRQAEG